MMAFRAAPDLACPECGHLDGVPVRVIERSRVERGAAVSRVVGKVYRCAHCAVEYCTGPSGVYQPRPKFQPPPPAPSKRADDELLEQHRSLRDADQPWERSRT